MESLIGDGTRVIAAYGSGEASAANVKQHGVYYMISVIFQVIQLLVRAFIISHRQCAGWGYTLSSPKNSVHQTGHCLFLHVYSSDIVNPSRNSWRQWRQSAHQIGWDKCPVLFQSLACDVSIVRRELLAVWHSFTYQLYYFNLSARGLPMSTKNG